MTGRAPPRRPGRRHVLWLLAGPFVVALAGCGRKGPLERPQDSKAQQRKQEKQQQQMPQQPTPGLPGG